MITKSTVIGEVLDNAKNPEAVATLLVEKFGMHCLHCPCSRMESIEQAAAVHGYDADALIEAIINADK
jgi:hybrid cluster-associated redox disulfide protein